MKKEKQIKRWEKFTEKNDFKLNDDKEIVETLAEGVLKNRKKHGLGYCPCRLTTGNAEEDLKLVCPCNFKVQKTWKEKGECWCSLFIRR